MIRNRNKKRKKAEQNKEKKGKKKKTQTEMAAIEGQSSKVANHMLRSSASPKVEIDNGRTAFLDNEDTQLCYQRFFGNDDNIIHSDFRLVEGLSKDCKLFLYYLRFILFIYISQGEVIFKTPQLRVGEAYCCLKMLFFIFHYYLI